MHTTTAQNKAHRNDIEWVKSSVDRSEAAKVPGEWWISEYHNQFTGQAIRKSGRMTGRDWFVFNAEGVRVDRAHSLTFAKIAASQPENA